MTGRGREMMGRDESRRVTARCGGQQVERTGWEGLVGGRKEVRRVRTSLGEQEVNVGEYRSHATNG